MKTKITILIMTCMSAWFTSCEEMPTVMDNVPVIVDLTTEEPEAENCLVKSVVEGADFSFDRTSVYFQCSQTTDFEYSEWLNAYSNNLHGFYYPIRGLEPGTKYYYRCIVRNNWSSDQEVISETASFTTDTRYRQHIYWSQGQTLYLGVDKQLKLNATSSSGLPVSYRVVSGGDIVELSNSTLYINSNGTAVIEASQDGNDLYYPATPVTKSFEIHDNKLIITDVRVEDWNSTNAGSSEVEI